MCGTGTDEACTPAAPPPPSTLSGSERTTAASPASSSRLALTRKGLWCDGGRSPPRRRTRAQLNCPCQHQPFFHINHAMRAVQFGKSAPTINVLPSTVSQVGTAGSYTAEDGWAKRCPSVLFSQTAADCLRMSCSLGALDLSPSVLWTGDALELVFENGSVSRLTKDDVQVVYNAWLMPSVSPLIALIVLALESHGAPAKEDVRHGHRRSLYARRSTTTIHVERVRKNYRGIAGVILPAGAYSEGSVVRWGAFTSASQDQGIAVSFAAGRNAAVFIIQGTTCVDIAPLSRFARERECLYLPNTLFRVVHALSLEQQQILGKDGLQLFEMREVNEQQANSLLVHSLLRRVRSTGAANVVLQAVESLESDGTLDMSLPSVHDGAVAPGWRYQIRIPTHMDFLFSPVAPTTDWVSAADQLAAVRLHSEVATLPPVPDDVDIQQALCPGVDTTVYDGLRQGYHCGPENHVTEALLRRRGGDATRGLRQVPCKGRQEGAFIMFLLGKSLGWVRWEADLDAETHRGSSDADFMPVTPQQEDTESESSASGDSLRHNRLHSSLRKRAGTRLRLDRGRTIRLRGRRGVLDSPDGWMPDRSDLSPWYQITLERAQHVGGLVLLPHGSEAAFVEKFKLSVTRNGTTWTPFQHGKVFDGLRSQDSPKLIVRLTPPVYVQGVRIHPVSSGSVPGLRAGLLVEEWTVPKPRLVFLYGPLEREIERAGSYTVHMAGSAVRTCDTLSMSRSSLASVLDSGPRSARGEEQCDSWAASVEMRFRSGRPGMAIGTEGAEVLAQVLRLGSPLRQVFLRNNRIGSLGLSLLLEALRSNRFVKEMELDPICPRFGAAIREDTWDVVQTPGPLLGAGWDRIRKLAIRSSDSDRLYGCIKSAISVRCMFNQDKLEASQIGVLDWPEVTAVALWDVPDLMQRLPLKTLVGERPELLDVFCRVLMCECKRRSQPLPRHLLHTVVSFGRTKLSNEVLDSGSADVEQLDDQGWSPLHYCAKHSAFDTSSGAEGYEVTRFLNRAATATTLTARERTKGWTPLVVAVYFYNTNTVSRLLELGADVDYVDYSGQSAVQWARLLEYADLAESLVANSRTGQVETEYFTPRRQATHAPVGQDLIAEHVTARWVFITWRGFTLQASQGPVELGVSSTSADVVVKRRERDKCLQLLRTMWFAVTRSRRAKDRPQSPTSEIDAGGVTGRSLPPSQPP
eukprot:TRINITY_DN1561_c2_g1_i2.p1 TRINITY_DN1561_c2_g1~~TRINITY_DN1561_c2_g1_i2.p1  ORF type:complete len:1202 (+),score=321.33 TRINITY_DN1561_c2_g1_i2:2109-5714(+)